MMLTDTKIRSIRPVSLLVSPNEKPLQRVRQFSDPDLVINNRHAQGDWLGAGVS